MDSDLVPYTVQTVRGDQLDGTRASNLTDYLARNLAGVNVNDIQGSPFQSDITYRGYRASSMPGMPQGLSVYLDGVRVNEPFGDVISWDMIPEAALASVSLVSSANPAYGLNSLGGALAMTTRSGLDSPGFTADLSYGSGNRKRRRPIRWRAQRQRLARLRRRHAVPGTRMARQSRRDGSATSLPRPALRVRPTAWTCRCCTAAAR
ncbi:TonB-dependent receptor plug domain-containing protein [Cupriavidus basilensis]